jgi:RNA polymerase sigma-54 factor
MIASEDQALTDQEIAERLHEYGYSVARRTVAKYRDQLDILPSSLR